MCKASFRLHHFLGEGCQGSCSILGNFLSPVRHQCPPFLFCNPQVKTKKWMADDSLKCYASQGEKNLNRYWSFKIMGEAQLENSPVSGDALFIRWRVQENLGEHWSLPSILIAHLTHNLPLGLYLRPKSCKYILHDNDVSFGGEEGFSRVNDLKFLRLAENSVYSCFLVLV